MKKPRKEPALEDRIENEAIVDAYGPQEQAMGWYYYLEKQAQLSVPGEMHCIEYHFAAQERRRCRGPEHGLRRCLC